MRLRIFMKKFKCNLIFCLIALAVLILLNGCKASSAPATDPAGERWQSGIFTEPKSLYDVNVINEWRGAYRDQHVILYAGAMEENPNQGVIIVEYYVFENGEWKLDGHSMHLTPRKHGELELIKYEKMTFPMKAKDGTSYTFDLPELEFIESSEHIEPSFTPGIYLGESDNKAALGYEAPYETVVSFINALVARDLSGYNKYLENPDDEYFKKLFQDRKRKFSFNKLAQIWTNDEGREVCVGIDTNWGDIINGIERDVVYDFCVHQDNQKQWKLYMID